MNSGQRVALVVPLSQENAVGTETGMHETGVLDQDALQAKDFVEGEGIPAGFEDGAAPALQAGARRALALDLETRPAVGQQHETRGARHQMGARAAHGFPRLGGKVEPQEPGERLGAPDDGAESAGAQQVVAHAMAFGEARLAYEIGFRIEKIDGGCGGRVVHIERAAGQDFVEIPCPPRRNAGGSCPNHGLDPAPRRRL